jgi:hypothetical protein
MKTLRLCLPWVPGRGAGLGNELVPWARAALAAQVLDAHCLAPAFGLNRRGYGRHFGTPAYDWIQQRIFKSLLPVVEFDQAAYLQHGGGNAVDALRSFALAHDLFNRRAYVLLTQGMWGGMHHIADARAFVTSKLQLSRFAARNLQRLRDRLDPARPVVAIHVRLGDFGAPLPASAYQGRFNVSLPPDWYRHVAQSIHAQLAGDAQFLIVSDGTVDQLQALFQGLPCVYTSDIPDSDCSDLLALAGADLIVCSVSSFSVWAAFLSDAPYLWFGPNLHRHPEGWLSIWGHEPGQQAPASPTRRAIEANQAGASAEPRGFAVWEDGKVPREALAQMNTLSRARHGAASDLVQYGVIRSGVQPTTTAAEVQRCTSH